MRFLLALQMMKITCKFVDTYGYLETISCNILAMSGNKTPLSLCVCVSKNNEEEVTHEL